MHSLDQLNREMLSSVLTQWISQQYSAMTTQAEAEITATESDQEQQVALRALIKVTHLEEVLTRGIWLDLLHQRLRTLMNQGGLPERPAPQFIEEITPERAPMIEPLRASLLALSSEEITQPLHLRSALSEGLTQIDGSAFLLLLGQRRTSASFTSILGLPPSQIALYESFEREQRVGKIISVGGRALTKHAARSEDPWWGHPRGNDQSKNEHARRILTRILSQSSWWNTFYHYKQGVVFEAREPQGHGARWANQGQRFIGFLEPFDEDRGGTARRVVQEMGNE